MCAQLGLPCKHAVIDGSCRLYMVARGTYVGVEAPSQLAIKRMHGQEP